MNEGKKEKKRKEKKRKEKKRKKEGRKEGADLGSHSEQLNLSPNFFFFRLFVFLGPHPRHMEVPRLGVQ